MPNDLLTLDQVGQFATLVFLCWAATQMLKRPLDALLARLRVGHVETRYVAFFVAAGLYLAVSAFAGPVTWEVIFLAGVNGLVVSMTAMKAHESAAQDEAAAMAPSGGGEQATGQAPEPPAA